MKKALITVLVCVSLLMLTTTATYAHELQKSGTVEVELHVDPDDSPMESAESHMGFEIVDSAKRFDISRCQCLLTIKKGSLVISEQEIKDLEVPFVFPEDGEYQVVLRGWPKRGFSFTPFDVTFPVRVLPRLAKPTVAPKSVDRETLNISLALLSLAILIVISVIVNSKSRK